MDVCLRKPLIATCGADKTVRIWNYISRKCELIKEFSEVPLRYNIVFKINYIFDRN